MTSKWINGNKSSFYEKQSSPISEIDKSMRLAALPDGKEVVLANPLNSSIVKIRNNGMIDIFTATNQGIRIDPAKHTINVLGEHEIHHIDNLTVWASKFIRMNAKRSIYHNSKESIYSDAKNDWTVKAGENIIMTSGKTVYIQSSDIKISAKGSMRFEAGNVMTFSAERYMYE